MTANQFRHICCFLLASFVGIASCHADKPNIVIVYADDMGYGDCTAYNSESKIPTPNIDRLAKEGMRLTDAHSPGATCTASRYGLLTGISPVRTGVLNGITNTGPAIDKSETTIARMLRDQGYVTNMIGKWHLGFDIPKGQRSNNLTGRLTGGPLDRGFDYFHGNEKSGPSTNPIIGRTPARAAVLTGKYSHKNGVTHLNQSFDGSQQTFPKLLQGAGYETSLFGKWHLLSQPTGFDFYCVQKMQGMAYDPIVFETGMPWVPWSPKDRKSYRKGGRVLKGYNNDAITTEALNWLKEKRDPSKPFCLCLHPKPPHQPYNPPKKYEDFLKDVTIPEPATLLDDYEGRTPEAIRDIMNSNRIVLGPSFKEHRAQLEKANPKITRDELTRAMYQEYIKGYYRLVKSVDDNVGRVLDYLDDSGLAKNTLVIYTSDQGFSLGEHGFYNKQWMYEGPLHQPLLVRFPGGIQAGGVHDSLVSHVDLAPTILEYAGVTLPDDMQGHSLKPILEGKADKVRDAAYYHFYEHGKRLPEMIGIRTATHKLIHYPGMQGRYQWELFDLQNDPEEMSNLYGSPEHKQTRESLKRGLRKLIKDLDDPVDAPKLMTDPQRQGAQNGDARSNDRPNIVLMMSDDQGWGETAYNGHPYLKTPVLDEMAASGLRLDRFYAASPVCTPTRASVLTGRHANRLGAFGAGWSIRPEEVTLGPLMKAGGYRTAHYGKWHVGAIKEGSPLSPAALGFDESLSHDNFFESNPTLSRNGKPAQQNGGESSEILVKEALDFAAQSKSADKPFFIVIWFGSPHSPYEALEKDRAPYKQLGEELSHRLGEIAAMDRAIGMFRDGLQKLGQRNNTLLWFNSE